MSGGVDSSVTAALAARTGAEVIGVTCSSTIMAKRCALGRLLRRAGHLRRQAGRRPARDRPLCARLRKPLSRGRDRPFVDEYARGRTPVPCARCNQGVKFVDLMAFARELGADCLATGHYVRRVVNGGRTELHKGADPRRDQSYFLYGTTREQLEFLRFPLGDLPKDEVRRIAAELGLKSRPSPTARISASFRMAIMPGW